MTKEAHIHNDDPKCTHCATHEKNAIRNEVIAGHAPALSLSLSHSLGHDSAASPKRPPSVSKRELGLLSKVLPLGICGLHRPGVIGLANVGGVATFISAIFGLHGWLFGRAGNQQRACNRTHFHNQQPIGSTRVVQQCNLRASKRVKYQARSPEF